MVISLLTAEGRGGFTERKACAAALAFSRAIAISSNTETKQNKDFFQILSRFYFKKKTLLRVGGV